ncbi:MAG: class I SAM-dependent methyltransferase [Pyrinomonadaceae bacterium]|nr:class I SAM-dependent methyltransferase [Pyrinomonadaceae bacterium]
MQLGLREEFAYFECSKCGCLQIEEIPADLSKYYPNNYYSYVVDRPSLEHPTNGIRSVRAKLIVKILSRHYFSSKNVLGAFVAEKSSLAGDYPYWVRHQQLNLRLHSNSSILDVGCGKGKLLLDLNLLGFSNLLGIDPFLRDDVVYQNGVRVLSKNIEALNQEFDLVMLHHSFEHMPEPLPTLRKAYELVKPGHYLLLRIPLAGSFAWRKYGVNWASLDAPRHLYLHTPNSVQILASQAGFEVAEVVYDSDGFAHWGSELYLRDIPLTDERSPWGGNRNQSTFSQEQLTQFTEQDEKLNKSGEADCAAFYLYKR